MRDRPTTHSGIPRSREALDPLLSVRHLTKHFPVQEGLRQRSLRAVSDVSFDLLPGEIVALVGESGSGKSTILRLLARLEAPSAGKIIYEGKDVLVRERRGASSAYRRSVQMIFQDPFGSLNPVHSVRHHLARPLLRHGSTKGMRETEARVLELLSLVGLSPPEDFARKHPHQMSGGQRQRVAIARALAVEPRIILADEPTSMLDVSLRVGILNLLDDLRIRRGLSYLYVTHDIASARYLADRTMVLYAGRIVEGGSSVELLRNPLHPYTKLLLEAVPDPRGSIFRPLPAKSGQPVLVDPPPGCPFAPRCPEVRDQCRQELPPLVALRLPGTQSLRQISCHVATDAQNRTAEKAGQATGGLSSAAGDSDTRPLTD